MHNREELIERFHEKTKRQLLKEFVKTGGVKAKAILLLLDGSEETVIASKNLPPILHLQDDDFRKTFAKVGRIKKYFVKTIEEDGYDVLCMFHVEFVEGQERLHTFLSKGEGLKETDVFEYHVVRETSFVLADGTLQFGKARFELQKSDF